ncbi:MAG: hypothetical protein AB8E15_13410 [Bdellovibrionales bacterium]
MTSNGGEISKLLQNIGRNPNFLLPKFLDDASLVERSALQEEFRSLLYFIDFTSILTDEGVVTEQSFISEFFYRFNKKFFPTIYADRDFYSYLYKMDYKYDFRRIFLQLSQENLARFFDWIVDSDIKIQDHLESKISEPLNILMIRLVYYGTSRQISSRIKIAPELMNCFTNAQASVKEFIKSPSIENNEVLLRKLDSCLEACELIRSNRLVEGISFDVTFRIIIIQDLVRRIRNLSKLKVRIEEENRSLMIAKMAQTLLESEKDSRKISTLFYRYVELVFFEITEHTGRLGENYIKNDSAGYRKMFKKGLLGGLIVGLFAFLKPVFSDFNLAPFIEIFSFSLIYSGIFLLIYFLNGVLATKQPSMTASRIAKELDESKDKISYLWNITEMLIDTFRTQFIAIMGNFIIAMPISAGIYLLMSESGSFRFTDASAQYLIDSLHPIFSLSLFYAFVTGGCLALSGIFSGAIRNWYIFNHIDQRIILSAKQNKWMTTSTAKKLISFLDTNLEGLSGNISLGFLLGTLSSTGHITGLPIDIRHITFAAAQAGTGLAHFVSDFQWGTFGVLVLSVLAIGLINLTVSFGITFLVAFRSRKLSFNQGRELISLLMKRFIKNPKNFFYR